MDIRLQDVDFSYAGDAGFRLRIGRLDIPAGQSLALTGPSGSGKTTLLRLLAGILSPQHGQIFVGDQSLPALADPQRRAFRIRHVGFVFQDFRLLDYLDVRENILLPYRINGALQLDAAVQTRLDELAAALGLTGRLGHHAQALSQGEKQRVAVARALLPGPRRLLADEPTGNLDGDNARRIMELLLHHARAAGATLVTATHDLALAGRFDRTVDFNTFAHAA